MEKIRLRMLLPGYTHFWGVSSYLCFSSGARSSHDGKTVRPDRYRGLTAFASLSMAVSERDAPDALKSGTMNISCSIL
jgi:hypothetical protein